MKPDVLICDESVSALDVSVQATVLNLLLDLQDEFGMTYIFISHDLAVVKYMADDMLVMNQGAIVERGNADAIYAAPQNEYTQKLLNAIPRGYSDPAVTARAIQSTRLKRPSSKHERPQACRRARPRDSTARRTRDGCTAQEALGCSQAMAD